MNGEYDRLRQLLLEQERDRMDALQDSVHQATERFERVPDLLVARTFDTLAARPPQPARDLPDAVAALAHWIAGGPGR